MQHDPFSPATAAIVLIGNELLSGKFRDENAAWLAGRLRTLGVDLRRIVTVPDVEADIVDEVRACADRYTHVFTSGGVGPTHDDITIDAIARAFEVPVVRDPTLEAILRAHFKERLNAAHLRMANVPAGTTLHHGGPIAWPVVRFRNVIILPGVPEIFRAKFDAISSSFQSLAFHIRNLWLNSDEGEIAGLLEEVERTFGVQIGSYPRIDHADHRVRITVEARRPAPVDAAVAALLSRLAPADVVRVDPPCADPEIDDPA
ncbi:competence/damage-inducible protein A [Myxococcota bacterium]|nr:competence/damage-inducible protein A [Myxococcota bacterium]